MRKITFTIDGHKKVRFVTALIEGNSKTKTMRAANGLTTLLDQLLMDLFWEDYRDIENALHNGHKAKYQLILLREGEKLEKR